VVPTDHPQLVSLIIVIVKVILVFDARYAMSCDPGEMTIVPNSDVVVQVTIDLLPDGDVTGLVSKRIPTNVLEPVSFICILLKQGLVVTPSEAMSSHPLARWTLVPDGDIVVDTFDSVAIHEYKAKALRDAELRLVILGGHAMVSDPFGRR